MLQVRDLLLSAWQSALARLHLRQFHWPHL